MKKRVALLLVLLVCLVFMPSVMAANVQGCEAVIPGVVIDTKIANTIHTIIVVIKIAVPILLVIFGMLDLGKAVIAQKEDEIKKGQQMFIKRAISAAIIFFVISVVQLLVIFVAGDEGIMNCASCFINGTDSAGICK